VPGLASGAEHDAAAVGPPRFSVLDGAVVVAVHRGEDETQALGEETHAGVDVGEADARPDGWERADPGGGLCLGSVMPASPLRAPCAILDSF
jgi:hypothetical protein